MHANVLSREKVMIELAPVEEPGKEGALDKQMGSAGQVWLPCVPEHTQHQQEGTFFPTCFCWGLAQRVPALGMAGKSGHWGCPGNLDQFLACPQVQAV